MLSGDSAEARAMLTWLCTREQEAMEVFKFYLYQDRLDARLDAESAAAVLHIAQYYGAPRLAGLCERLLAREIRRRDPDDEGATHNHLPLCRAQFKQHTSSQHLQDSKSRKLPDIL